MLDLQLMNFAGGKVIRVQIDSVCACVESQNYCRAIENEMKSVDIHTFTIRQLMTRNFKLNEELNTLCKIFKVNDLVISFLYMKKIQSQAVISVAYRFYALKCQVAMQFSLRTSI